MPTTLHTLTGEPDEPDRPAPQARLRWRLSLDVIVHTYVPAPDEQTACLTVTDALRHPDTVIALSRAEPDAVPPWRALGTAYRVELYWDVDAVDTGTDDGVWKCTTLLLLRFTVSPATSATTHRHETGGRTGAPAGQPPGAPACRLTRAPPCPTVPNHPGRTP